MTGISQVLGFKTKKMGISIVQEMLLIKVAKQRAALVGCIKPDGGIVLGQKVT